MKKLIFIGGTMGVGKTTVSEALKRELDSCVFLDGDWCWDMHPFIVNKKTKEMVIDNITHLLNNFIHCNQYQHIIFCWVMHQQEIIDDILFRLDIENCEVYQFSLICSPELLEKQLQGDIDLGLRKKDIILKSQKRLDLYKNLKTTLIDKTNLSLDETVQKIKKFIQE